MKCENVLCRDRSVNKKHGCIRFKDTGLKCCLQYNLYNAVIIQTERKTNVPFSDIIHDAANQVQKENF